MRPKHIRLAIIGAMALACAVILSLFVNAAVAEEETSWLMAALGFWSILPIAMWCLGVVIGQPNTSALRGRVALAGVSAYIVLYLVIAIFSSTSSTSGLFVLVLPGVGLAVAAASWVTVEMYGALKGMSQQPIRWKKRRSTAGTER